MTELRVYQSSGLSGRVRVPGDKSISHRALMLGALAEGDSHIAGFLPGGDCLATLGCMRALGIEAEVRESIGENGVASADVTIHGRGLRGLQASSDPLDCVRSGTTMRLLAGILAGQSFDSVLTGDPQLLRRPMRRITTPLRAMGADITDDDGRAPLYIRGRRLQGITHRLTVASAQVKSAILLAGLFAEGTTVVHECGHARDHTERMLAAMGANITTNDLNVTLIPNPQSLNPLSIIVPGDISSAAFPLVAALLAADSEITLRGIGVNPTRTGLLDVLASMGADIALKNRHERGGEPVADVTARTSALRGTEIGGDTVVRMIDEFPILAMAATQAEGRTVVRDATELRVKETDRVAVVVEELRKLGATIEPLPDGFIIEGSTSLRGTAVDSHGDHRLGMALAVAGLVAEGETVIENAGCIADSFPGFGNVLRSLGATLAE